MKVKPKYVWKVIFSNFWKFVNNFQLFVYIFSKNLLPLKHILALTTNGLKCTISVLLPFFNWKTLYLDTLTIFQNQEPPFWATRSCLSRLAAPSISPVSSKLAPWETLTFFGTMMERWVNFFVICPLDTKFYVLNSCIIDSGTITNS